jgi:hypothetical protein
MALGRLYALTAMGRKAIGMLQAAQKLNTEDPRPDKYLAVANVDAYYQYDTALSLESNNCYAHYYLAHVYARRYNNTSKLDPRRKTFLARYQEHVAMTRSYGDVHPLRVEMLNRWIVKVE